MLTLSDQKNAGHRSFLHSHSYGSISGNGYVTCRCEISKCAILPDDVRWVGGGGGVGWWGERSGEGGPYYSDSPTGRASPSVLYFVEDDKIFCKFIS